VLLKVSLSTCSYSVSCC